MSGQTWLQEFYPVSAFEFCQVPRTDLELIEHSLTKWRGLTEANMSKHGVTKYGESVMDNNEIDNRILRIDGGSCALCERYLNSLKMDTSEGCSACPLNKVRLGFDCDRITEDEEDSPYWQYSRPGGNPKAMIELLEKAHEAVKNGYI